MSIKPIRQLKADKMSVRVYNTSDEMGRAAAYDCAQAAIELLMQKEEVNIIFAPADSQADFRRHFFEQPGVDWTRMNAFILIGFLGMPEDSPNSISAYARQNIFSKAPFKNTFAPNSAAVDFQAECDRYASLLEIYPIDMACVGIGENGHVAGNEPWVADFNDPVSVKYFKLDEEHSGAQSAPRHLLTVTMPFITDIGYKQIVAPGSVKKEGIYRTMYDSVSEDCPSTVLRKSDCILYTDAQGASLL